MGKVISITREEAVTAARERDQVLFDGAFLTEIEELDSIMDADLYKRITYEMMDAELSMPLLKPMWPLCSGF
jgi:hypothetical protein